MSTKIKNIFNFSFLKQKKTKSRRESADIVLDAAPDNDSVKKSRQGHYERNLKHTNGKGQDFEKESENIHSTSDPEKDNSSRKENYETHSNEKSQENINPGNFDSSKGNVININNGTGIHFGNVINIQNQTNVNGFPTVFEEKKKERKSLAVKALLRCDEKIDDGYLDFLSNHIGKQCELLGPCLKLSSCDQEEIMEQFKGSRERCFAMLSRWHQKQDQHKATIGHLCKILWKSKLKNAREAVDQMSVYIQDLN